MYLNGSTKRIAYLNGVQSDIQKYMQMHYEDIDEIILRIKSSDNKIYFKLVAIETQLILDIISELYEKFDDIKILTCHDAIYVPSSFEEQVKIVWDKHMNLFTKDLPREDLSIGIDLSEYGIFDADLDDDLNGSGKNKETPGPFIWDGDAINFK